MNFSQRQFEDSPLITPERLTEGLETAFGILPPWVSTWASIYEDDQPPSVAVALGKKYPVVIILTPAQFAYLAELTRLGHSVATNSNFGCPPRSYAKLTIRDAAKDTMPVSRLFVDAREHEAVVTVETRTDLRPWNLAKIGAGKPKKDAVETVTRHVERIAKEREAGGTLPPHFTKAEYLANFRALLAIIEAERQEVTAS